MYPLLLKKNYLRNNFERSFSTKMRGIFSLLLGAPPNTAESDWGVKAQLELFVFCTYRSYIYSSPIKNVNIVFSSAAVF